MSGEVRRTVKWRVEQYDPQAKVVYVRVEEGGAWLGSFPIKLRDLRRAKDKRKYISSKVAEFVNRLSPPEPPKGAGVPEEGRLEGEVEV